MIGIAKFDVLLLTNYWILGFSQFHFIFGAKPRCKGVPLDPKDFSDKEDVGFVRDICVDKIARILYNKLQRPVSDLCEDLGEHQIIQVTNSDGRSGIHPQGFWYKLGLNPANMRTSTCFCKCLKWKRSSFWNKRVSNQITNMAVALMKDFNKEVSKDASLNYEDQIFIFDHINNAKQQLINSGAITENSPLVDQLEDLKNNFCTRRQLSYHQKTYQDSIGKNDAETLQKLSDLLKNDDLVLAIRQFIRNYQTRNEVKILNYFVVEQIVKSSRNSQANLFRLEFKFREDDETKASTVFLKIPSLDPHYPEFVVDNIYAREALMYEKILPLMYAVGPFEPFAPILIAASHGSALVMEDLAGDGYEHCSLSEPFDLDHSRKALNVLAIFHATGYRVLRELNKNDPSMSLIKSYQPTVQIPVEKYDFDRFCKWVEPLVSRSLYQKILNAEDKVLAASATQSLPNENNMTILLHGDLQPGNIFFKYDKKGKIHQAKLIDFEFSREGNPVLDLIDFLIMNVSIEVFDENEDNLLDFYVLLLNNTLKLINAGRQYSRNELHSDIMAYYKDYFFRQLILLCKFGEKYTYTEPSGEENNPYVFVLVKWLHYFERKSLI